MFFWEIINFLGGVSPFYFIFIFIFLFSAGVGRTGTYIALDALYHTGRQTGKVNVVEFVKKMRESRVSMVQTFVSLDRNI